MSQVRERYFSDVLKLVRYFILLISDGDLYSVVCVRSMKLIGWMGDRQQMGKPSRYVTNHPGQLGLAIPPWVGALHDPRIRNLAV